MFKYLRVSVTDRCNYRCTYCMPEEGIKKHEHSEILRYEEILAVIAAAVECGVEQVRITGGEPLVRSGIVDFVKDVSRIKGLTDITLTTNGSLLKEFAQDLKQAGLMRVNISLDSLNEKTFRKISRNGNLEDVIRGVDAAMAVGLRPVKINTVLIPGLNDSEILDFVEFAKNKMAEVRFIERMPFNNQKQQTVEFISQDQVIEKIKSRYQLEKIDSGSFGPAASFRIAGSQGIIGFISSHSSPFCKSCQRLRLTASGVLLPCLDSVTGKKIRKFAHNELIAAIKELYSQKASWQKNNASFTCTYEDSLAKIGG